jgi:hypothetical protein
MKGFILIDNVGFMPENAESLSNIFADLSPEEIQTQLGLPKTITLAGGKKEQLTLEQSIAKCRAFAAALSANNQAPNAKFIKGDANLPGLARTCNAVFLAEELGLDITELYKEGHEELLAKVEALVNYKESPSDDTLLALSELVPSAIDTFAPAELTEETIGNVADAIAENQTTAAEETEGVTSSDEAADGDVDGDVVEDEEVVAEGDTTPTEEDEIEAGVPVTADSAEENEQPVLENGNLGVEPATTNLPSNDVNVIEGIVTTLAATAVSNAKTAEINSNTANVLAKIVDKLFPPEAKAAAADVEAEMTEVN